MLVERWRTEDGFRMNLCKLERSWELAEVEEGNWKKKRETGRPRRRGGKRKDQPKKWVAKWGSFRLTKRYDVMNDNCPMDA